MNNLINAIYQLVKVVIDSVTQGFDALSRWLGKFWWFIVAFIVTPITWIIDWATSVLVWCTSKCDWMAGQVESMGFSDIKTTFSSFSYYLGILDFFVPVAFMFFIAASLVVLWVVCTIVRIVIRLIPTAG